MKKKEPSFIVKTIVVLYFMPSFFLGCVLSIALFPLAIGFKVANEMIEKFEKIFTDEEQF